MEQENARLKDELAAVRKANNDIGYQLSRIAEISFCIISSIASPPSHWNRHPEYCGSKAMRQNRTFFSLFMMPCGVQISWLLSLRASLPIFLTLQAPLSRISKSRLVNPNHWLSQLSLHRSQCPDPASVSQTTHGVIASDYGGIHELTLKLRHLAPVPRILRWRPCCCTHTDMFSCLWTSTSSSVAQSPPHAQTISWKTRNSE